MSVSLHAAHYADAMVQLDAPIIRNDLIAENTHKVQIVAPEIAANYRPGQFVMIRLAGLQSPLIGRAFAVYDHHDDANGQPSSIDLIYIRKGALTRPLADAPVGTRICVWGPLGNGFSTTPCEKLILAVGGIGQTPMLVAGRHALHHQWADSIEMIYGVRRASLLAGVDDFRDAGFDVTLCTDDGSAGVAARVPDVLQHRLEQLQAIGETDSVRVLTCGPEIMMQKVAEVCQSWEIPCEVSMETPMACGIGICFSCVAKVNQPDGGWDYKRTCVEGPIFDSKSICWDD
ncbi:MAG: dihydroorotate dehydrogenase electron transfer subunit [Planctomycetota bacterium]